MGPAPMADGVLTEEREQENAELRLLEELWTAPPAREAPAPVRRPRFPTTWLADRLGWILAFGWGAFIVSVFFEPAPEPNQIVPVWADALVAGFFLSLGAAGIMAAMRAGRGTYAVATVAGLAGMALGVACGTTGHHASGWWVYELGATSVLTALAVTGLARRR